MTGVELSDRSEPKLPARVDPVPPGGWDRPIAAPPPPGVPASWGKRLGAAFVDALIVGVPAAAFTAALVAVLAGVGLFEAKGAASLAIGVVAVVGVLAASLIVLLAVTMVYAPFLMRRAGRRNGQTWGKQLFGIRVVRSNGDPQSLGSAAFREGAVKVLAFGLASSVLLYVPTLLDVLWPLWDRENRALHDLMSDTRVIRV